MNKFICAFATKMDEKVGTFSVAKCLPCSGSFKAKSNC
jgi:hypothetical protein